MKAKKIVTEKSKHPNPSPALLSEQREDELAPWQKEIVALAGAYLSINGEQDCVSQLLKRALGLSSVVEDMALGDHESQIDLEGLARIMEVIQEQIWVAWWMSAGKPLDPHWY